MIFTWDGNFVGSHSRYWARSVSSSWFNASITMSMRWLAWDFGKQIPEGHHQPRNPSRHLVRQTELILQTETQAAQEVPQAGRSWAGTEQAEHKHVGDAPPKGRYESGDSTADSPEPDGPVTTQGAGIPNPAANRINFS